MYSACSESSGPNMEHIRDLGQQLINHYSSLARTRPRGTFADAWSCSACAGVLVEPVTLNCGHSACRKCLVKDLSQVCRKCGIRHRMLGDDPVNDLDSLKVSVMVGGLVSKLWDKEIKAADLRNDGNRLFQRGDVEGSIQKYSEAFTLAPNDHLVASNRSNAYFKQGKYLEALEDANKTISVKRDWGKGYFRRGMALSALGNYAEALVAYFECLILEGSCSKPLKAEILKVLHKLVNESRAPVSETAAGRPGSSSSLDCLVTASSQLLEQQDQEEEEEGTSSSRYRHKEPPARRGSLTSIVSGSECGMSVCSEGGGLGEPLAGGSGPSEANTSETESEVSMDRRSASTSRKRRRELVVPRNRMVCNALEILDNRIRSLVSSLWVQEPRRVSDRVSVDPQDLECSLCFRILWQPVTTGCGHTYCRSCLDRSLDHRKECPLCKSVLEDHNTAKLSVNEFIEQTARRFLPAEFQERQKGYEEEMLDLVGTRLDGRVQIPVFVCTMSYPCIPCPLHVFEPRYRLMIRRCMESGTREFGMCIKDQEKTFADIGTMLEIRDIQYFPDGRGVVDTIGSRRFRVIERGSRDGYNTAVVEFLKDEIPTGQNLQEVQALHDEIRSKAVNWFNNSIPPEERASVAAHYGSMPRVEQEYWSSLSGPAWAWWVLAILPLDPVHKIRIMSQTELKSRLVHLGRILNYMTRLQGQQQQQRNPAHS